MLLHRASQRLGQAANMLACGNVARQQGQKRSNGRVFVLGIRTGTTTSLPRSSNESLLPASAPSACRMDYGLGQRDLTL